MATAVICQTR